MAKQLAVWLNISTTNEPGWKSVLAEDADHPGNPKKTYWYRFSGGNTADKNGDQDADDSKVPDDFLLGFATKDVDAYDFVDFWKDKDLKKQLTGNIINNKKKVRVTNKCTEQWDDMVYGVTVGLAANNRITIRCDPVISNKAHTLDWLALLVRRVQRMGSFFTR